MKPFYDPTSTYEENYRQGPSGPLADDPEWRRDGEPLQSFLGHPVHQPFGIPAGPLLNAAYCEAAFRQGFDICVYKTVRSAAYPCNPFPNVLAVHVEGPLTPQRVAAGPLLADDEYRPPLSISNSFGVPSRDPDVWQPDMARAVDAAGTGQILVGSFQGTHRESASVGDAYVLDHVRTARLVVETGARVVELNLSCPNEGTSRLLCFDAPRVQAIADAVKDAIGDVPLVLKLAYFADHDALADLVGRTCGIVQGYCAINTIPARLVGPGGSPALPGAGRDVSGVCGAAIAWAGLDMTDRLARLREELDRDFAIVGVGGVESRADYLAYRGNGADAVMSATGAMWNAHLAREVAGL